MGITDRGNGNTGNGNGGTEDPVHLLPRKMDTLDPISIVITTKQRHRSNQKSIQGTKTEKTETDRNRQKQTETDRQTETENYSLAF